MQARGRGAREREGLQALNCSSNLVGRTPQPLPAAIKMYCRKVASVVHRNHSTLAACRAGATHHRPLLFAWLYLQPLACTVTPTQIIASTAYAQTRAVITYRFASTHPPGAVSARDPGCPGGGRR